jgi:16S rRNA (guanine(966)-N(2))-methyltransferase RsmD
MSLRVIAGRYGGRRLAAPAGRATRPTGERAREALFSMLGPLDGLRVLDLFAGSGALGIEALSRGAEAAVFVERAPRAARAIAANLEALGLALPAAELRRQDALAFLRDARARSAAYDLVFLDPPYRLAGALSHELPAALAEVVAAGGRVVSESDRRAPLELALPLSAERRYGDTLIRIYDTE